MIRLLQLLIFGHVHQWETQATAPLMNRADKPCGQVAYLRCTKCGIWKRQELA